MGKQNPKRTKDSGRFYYNQLQSFSRCLLLLPSSVFFFQNCRSNYDTTLYMLCLFFLFFLIFFFWGTQYMGMSVIHARTVCFLQRLMQTRIYCWQPKVPKLGSGSLLHWELYRLNRKLLASGISVYSFFLEIVKFVSKTFPIQTASTITFSWVPAITLAQISSRTTSHLPQNWIHKEFCWGWLRKNRKPCLFLV